MADRAKIVVNRADVEEIERLFGEHAGGYFRPLTPAMKDRGGSLGVNLMRVPPGRAAVPFHQHQLEDEVFYILSGSGALRYGDALEQLRAGDCVSCPAGAGVAHQIANTGDEDLVYLSVGQHEPNEVCVYPDTGKVMVRSLQRVGYLEPAGYHDDEPDPPKIFELARSED